MIEFKGSVDGKSQKEKETFDVWQCPYCKYIIDDTRLMNIKYDTGCPRCHTSLIKFHLIKDW
jgi:rubrerythrin